MKAQLKSWLFRNNKQAGIKALCRMAGGFIALCWLPSNMQAQTNLVPNPSFEIYSSCPTQSGQIYLATPWYGPVTNVNSDYLNACSPEVSVPSGNGYFQYARTGNAYAAILSYISFNPNYRKYIQVQLTDTLKKGKCYYVEFYVNMPEYSRYGTNNQGAFLSKDTISTTGTGYVLSLNPQILNYGNPVIIDTLNWIRVSSIYTAQGAERFLTIGNFFDDSHTDTIVNPHGYYSSFYFIDDVSVTEITSTYTPTWHYRDTSVVKGDSVYIGTRTNGLKCIWYNNGNIIADSVPGLYVKPTVSSTYVVKENLPCANTRYDTLVVTVVLKSNGIAEISGFSNLRLYPNPVTDGILHITGIKNNETITLYNLLGEKALQTKAAETVDLSGFPNGVYFICVTNTATNETTIKKLVIQQ